MLEPYFFQMPPSVAKGWNPDLVFAVLGYARIGHFTLVKWRFGGDEEYATGETLYRDQHLIASGGGRLPLYTPPEPPDTNVSQNATYQKVWDRVDPSIGAFGVPPTEAQALRDPTNYVSFE